MAGCNGHCPGQGSRSWRLPRDSWAEGPGNWCGLSHTSSLALPPMSLSAIAMIEILAQGNGRYTLPPWSLVSQATLLPDPEPGTLYDLARHLALAMTLPGGKPAGDPGGRAVKVPQKCIAAGFDNVYLLRNDPKLAPLRARNDFRCLVQTLESPAFAGTRKREN